MNFDNHQKEIIKAINDGKVYDILSFVKEFGYYEKYQLSLEELQKSFDKREKDRKYPVNVKRVCAPPYEKEKTLEYVSSEMVTVDYFFATAKGKKFKYNTYEEKGICIKTSFDEIKNFIAIWEYLKTELDVLEVKKDIDKEEVGLFFERASNKKYDPNKAQTEPDKIIILDADENGEVHYKEKISAMEFIPEILVCNEEELLICEEYLEKKIIPTPALRNFIEEDFSTPDQIMTKKSLDAAWIAIKISIFATVISIFATIFSVYATYKVDPSDANLKQIQEQLKDIEAKIDTANDEQLEQILTEIQKIKIPEYDAAAMQESIEGIEENLAEIKGYIEEELNK